MSKYKLHAIASFWPLIYLGLVVLFVILTAILASQNQTSIMFSLLSFIGIIHFLTMVDIIALLVIDIKDCFHNPRVPQEKRLMWALLIFFFNIIVFPIYWNKFIKIAAVVLPPESPVTQAPQNPQAEV